MFPCVSRVVSSPSPTHAASRQGQQAGVSAPGSKTSVYQRVQSIFDDAGSSSSTLLIAARSGN